MSDLDQFWNLGRSLRAFVDGLAASEPVQGGASAPATGAAASATSAGTAFPDAGIDAFLSHFVFTIQLNSPKSHPVNITLPVATQTVARSRPFTFHGPGDTADVPLPAGSTLSPRISYSDFPQRPAPFFEPGKQVVWLQILNLDARGDTPLGPMRIILGETMKREYPDLFEPSLGVAQSLGRSGFPARLFFDPCAIVETKAGHFRAVHGVLAYGRINEFPPVGSAVQTTDVIPLHTVDQLRSASAAGAKVNAAALAPTAQVLGLAHPIDATLRVSGEQAFGLVEQSIATTK
jgi:hypothetical protein